MAYKEKDTKKWTAQWFETTAKGEKKKRRKRGFDTKRDALEYKRQKKPNSIRSMDMKLNEFLDVYFEDKQNELKERSYSQHLIVTLNYGEQSISSDIFNMLYDENYSSVDNEEMDRLDTPIETVILSISNVGFSYQQVDWVHIDNNQILGDDIELIDNRYNINS